MGSTQWHILVVENQAGNTFCISETLSDFGIGFMCVTTLEEALSELETSCFTHVIVDLGLQQISPWRVLNRLKVSLDHIAVPCIAVTDFYEFRLAEAAIEAGFRGYFIKPVDDIVLLCALQNTIDD